VLTDVWEDEKSLQFLHGEPLGNEVTEKEKERMPRRCRAYRFADGVLLRKLATGEEKIVLAPAQQEPLVAETHGQTGHWGEWQTLHLLHVGLSLQSQNSTGTPRPGSINSATWGALPGASDGATWYRVGLGRSWRGSRIRFRPRYNRDRTEACYDRASRPI
jgi:hypothetical protein